MSCRALEQLAKLAEHKDNNVFKDLATLAAPDLELKEAVATSKELCQVGLQSGLFNCTDCAEAASLH